MIGGLSCSKRVFIPSMPSLAFRGSLHIGLMIASSLAGWRANLSNIIFGNKSEVLVMSGWAVHVLAKNVFSLSADGARLLTCLVFRPSNSFNTFHFSLPEKASVKRPP